MNIVHNVLIVQIYVLGLGLSTTNTTPLVGAGCTDNFKAFLVNCGLHCLYNRIYTHNS